jgi:hypothetical protein
MNSYWKRICLIFLINFFCTFFIANAEEGVVGLPGDANPTANNTLVNGDRCCLGIISGQTEKCLYSIEKTQSCKPSEKLISTGCIDLKNGNAYPACSASSAKSMTPTSDTSTISKEPEAKKSFCCDCSKKGGSVETVTAEVGATAKCSCSATPEPGECNKVLEDLKKEAKDGLNKAGFYTGKKGVIQIIGKVTNFLIFPIGAIMMALYIWAGFLWMTAQGNSENISTAKSILVWTTLGVVATLASYLIVQFVFKNIIQI